MILRSTAVLPAMFTIGNGLAGFAAIHFATKPTTTQEAFLSNLSLAAWLIFLAMVFDMLDGRVARLTRKTSDFGAQLDSLCDVISFGAAPAVLMLRTVVRVLEGQIEQVSFLAGFPVLERVIWLVAAAYVACAALRLARFNVENEPDESAHMDFRGLPSPGAAAAVAGLILLFRHLSDSQPWVLITMSVVLTVVTLAVALLMVSRFRYPHLVNQYIRGKRPFSYLIKLLGLVLAALLWPFMAIAAATVAYALSGPAAWSWHKVRRGKTTA